MYAWEKSFVERLSEFRQTEMSFILKASYLKALSSCVMFLGPTIMTLIAFLTLGATDPNFTAQRVFVALVYFNLLRLPMMMLPMTFTAIAEAQVSVDRISSFLMAPELDSEPERLTESPFAIEIDNATYGIRRDLA